MLKEITYILLLFAGTSNGPSTIKASAFKVDPNKQQINYTILKNDGTSQKYVTMLPKEFDKNAIVKTISAHVSKDTETRVGTLKIELPKHMISPQEQSVPSSTLEKEAVKPKKIFLNNERKNIRNPIVHKLPTPKNTTAEDPPTLTEVYNNSRGTVKYFSLVVHFLQHMSKIWCQNAYYLCLLKYFCISALRLYSKQVKSK